MKPRAPFAPLVWQSERRIPVVASVNRHRTPARRPRPRPGRNRGKGGSPQGVILSRASWSSHRPQNRAAPAPACRRLRETLRRPMPQGRSPAHRCLPLGCIQPFMQTQVQPDALLIKSFAIHPPLENPPESRAPAPRRRSCARRSVAHPSGWTPCGRDPSRDRCQDPQGRLIFQAGTARVAIHNVADGAPTLPRPRNVSGLQGEKGNGGRPFHLAGRFPLRAAERRKTA